MQPLSVFNTGPNSNPGPNPGARLAQDIIDTPLRQADPPIDSWPELLAPKALHLRLAGTETCSSDCVYCERIAAGAGERSHEPNLPAEIWERVRDVWLPKLSGIECAGLGEPTLTKLFPQVAAETLAAGKVLYFASNGKHLDTKVTDCLGDGTNVRVSVSLDAGDAETYAKVGRGTADEWPKVLESIRAFREKCPNAFLHTQYTASILNQDSFPAFAQIACDLGFREIIWRLVQNVGMTAREDMSLRFARDLTERTLSEGWQAVEDWNAAHPDAPVLLNAERRPYSEFSPNSLTTPAEVSDPASRLKRYLDFAPMSVLNCPACTPSSSLGQGVTSAVQGDLPAEVISYYRYINSDCSGCFTQSATNLAFLWDNYPATPAQADATPYSMFNHWNEQCIAVSTITGAAGTSSVCTFTTVTSSNVGSAHAALSTATDNPPAATYSACITYTCPAAATNTLSAPNNDTFVVTNFTCSGDCTTTHKTEFYPGGGSFPFDPGTIGFCGQSEGGPEIVRSVVVPRSMSGGRAGGFEAESVGEPDTEENVEKRIKYIDASPVVWADGTISTCFARHVIGNVMADTLETLIAGTRYQAFLQNRAKDPLTEEWCAVCPRTF